jgi:hypothetical protein
MARSEEALQRRAEKRERSVEDQKQAEVQDMKRPKDSPMDETGAWKCPQCNNHNFASRRVCNSKTCNQRRPSHIPAPPRRDQPGPSWRCSCGRKNYESREICFNNYCGRPKPEDIKKTKKPPRHDESTSKKVVWANQADGASLSKNQDLRKRYLETNGEGMEPEDVERAKILIARDERKSQKKGSLTQTKTSETPDSAVEPIETTTEKKQKQNDKEDSKSTRDKNKALRKRFKETGGEGMKPERIERAKQLIERDERKRLKRELAVTEKNQKSVQ